MRIIKTRSGGLRLKTIILMSRINHSDYSPPAQQNNLLFGQCILNLLQFTKFSSSLFVSLYIIILIKTFGVQEILVSYYLLFFTISLSFSLGRNS